MVASSFSNLFHFCDNFTKFKYQKGSHALHVASGRQCVQERNNALEVKSCQVHWMTAKMMTLVFAIGCRTPYLKSSQPLGYRCFLNRLLITLDRFITFLEGHFRPLFVIEESKLSDIMAVGRSSWPASYIA